MTSVASMAWSIVVEPAAYVELKSVRLPVVLCGWLDSAASTAFVSGWAAIKPKAVQHTGDLDRALPRGTQVLGVLGSNCEAPRFRLSGVVSAPLMDGAAAAFRCTDSLPKQLAVILDRQASPCCSTDAGVLAATAIALPERFTALRGYALIRKASRHVCAKTCAELALVDVAAHDEAAVTEQVLSEARRLSSIAREATGWRRVELGSLWIYSPDVPDCLARTSEGTAISCWSSSSIVTVVGALLCAIIAVIIALQ